MRILQSSQRIQVNKRDDDGISIQDGHGTPLKQRTATDHMMIT